MVFALDYFSVANINPKIYNGTLPAGVAHLPFDCLCMCVCVEANAHCTLHAALLSSHRFLTFTRRFANAIHTHTHQAPIKVIAFIRKLVNAHTHAYIRHCVHRVCCIKHTHQKCIREKVCIFFYSSHIVPVSRTAGCTHRLC